MLTPDECKQLEQRVQDKLDKLYPEGDTVTSLIRKITIQTSILVIREYENLKDPHN